MNAFSLKAFLGVVAYGITFDLPLSSSQSHPEKSNFVPVKRSKTSTILRNHKGLINLDKNKPKHKPPNRLGSEEKNNLKTSEFIFP
jgi:hypothetical protein